MYKKLIVLLLSFGILLIPSGASASTHAKSLQNLGMNEVMFAQMMIPHHEQAVSWNVDRQGTCFTQTSNWNPVRSDISATDDKTSPRSA